MQFSNRVVASPMYTWTEKVLSTSDPRCIISLMHQMKIKDMNYIEKRRVCRVFFLILILDLTEAILC